MLNFSEQDISFLRTQKRQGIDAVTALNKLQQIKNQQIGQLSERADFQPSQPPLPPFQPPQRGLSPEPEFRFGAITQAFGRGLGQAAIGAGELISGISTPIQMGLEAATRPLRGGIRALAGLPPETRPPPIGAITREGIREVAPGEAAELGVRGLGDIVGGGFQTAFAPLTGAIQTLPGGIREPIEQVAGLPTAAIEGLAKEIVKIVRPDFDVESPEVRKNILEPVQRAFQLATLKGLKGVTRIARAEKAITKAEKFTTEILQPPTPQLTAAIQKGTTLPAVHESIKAMKTAKTYDELLSNFGATMKHTWSTLREKLTPVAGRNINKSYLDGIREKIAEYAKSEHTKSAAQNMQKVLDTELRDWNAARGYKVGMDRGKLNTAQGKKMYLNDLLFKEFERLKKGTPTAFETARMEGLDLIRNGLMKEIERIGGKEVGILNRTYGGLNDATGMLARQSATARKTVTPTVAQKVAGIIPATVSLVTGKGGLSALLSRAAKVSKILKGRTGKIQQLTKKAAREKAIAAGESLPVLPTILRGLITKGAPQAAQQPTQQPTQPVPKEKFIQETPERKGARKAGVLARQAAGRVIQTIPKPLRTLGEILFRR